MKSKSAAAAVVLLWFLSVSAGAAFGRQIFVDADAVGANDGSSWGNAFNHLRDAIAACSSGDEIRVAQGVYKPDRGAGVTAGDRGATFQLTDEVVVRGGYAGYGQPIPDARNITAYETILSGDLHGNDSPATEVRYLLTDPTRSGNSYNVVTGTDCGRTAVLDGFTITGGNANGTRSRDRVGGGIHDGDLTVSYCKIVRNSAAEGGAGVGCYGGAALMDCNISDNSALYAGGVYNVQEVANCTISRNWATVYSGGGMSILSDAARVTDSTFSDNSAAQHGGAVHVMYSDPVFTRCTFSNNWAMGNGGGLYVDGSTSGGEPFLYQCRIVQNTTEGAGGGVYSYGYTLSTLTSCLVIGNVAAGDGGGICDTFNASSAVLNCTLAQNTASGRGGAICYDSEVVAGRLVTNSILWNNSDSLGGTSEESQLFIKSGPAESPILYSCIQGWSGTMGGAGQIGTIGEEPAFADANGADEIAGTEDDNLRLSVGSPCIDSGDNSVVEPGAVDLDGKPRIVHSFVDMGAYESEGYGKGVPPRYEIIDLGTLGGSYSRAYGINELGRIVGTSQTAGGQLHAFAWDDEVGMIDIGTLGGSASTAYAINRAGRVVGSARTASGELHAFLWDKGKIIDLGILPGGSCTEALAINDAEQVVGPARTSATIYTWQRAFLWENDAIADLGLLSGAGNSSASDINIRGQVTGTSGDRAFLWDSTTGMRDLVGFQSQGNAINDRGTVAVSSLGTYYLWDAIGGLLDMNLIQYSRVNALNNNDQVVGDFDYLGGANTHAFLWDSSYGMVDLNDFVTSDPTWKELYSAGEINDKGQIVGYGLTDTDQWHAFLMNPVPADSCLVAHWMLDETEGSVAQDAAGDNHGFLQGDPQWRPYSGRMDGAMEFDGEGDYINCGNSAVFDLTEHITLAAWVNINAVNVDWQAIVTKGDSAWRLSTVEDEMRFHFAVTGGPPWNFINGNTQVAPHEWHHICGTYDGENMRLYIDGIEDSASPVPESNGISTNSYNVLIGENEENPDRYWDGLLDDIRIYSCPLTDAEIRELFLKAPIYVDQEAPGANNGSSWTDAFTGVQDALTSASGGNHIHVASGMYKPDFGSTVTPGDRNAAFQLVDGVSLRGGFAGFGEPNPKMRDFQSYETVLSGDLAGDDGPQFANNTENSRHVVTADGTSATALLEGFTITAGNAENLGGGGIRILSGMATLQDCRFVANSAGRGGGMYNESSSPTIINVEFRDNRAFLDDAADNPRGGGMYNYKSSPRIENCLFVGNAVGASTGDGGDGGAIFCGDSNPTLVNCVMRSNTAWIGGGMTSWWGRGGTLVNCVFNSNSAGSRGGALDSFENNPTLINCTFTANAAAAVGGVSNEGGNMTVVNSILHGNIDGTEDIEDAQITTTGGDLTISFSCVEGWTGLLGGTNNIDAETVFIDPPGADGMTGTEDDDLRPAAGSLVIDSGDNSALLPFVVVDLDGNPRIIRDIVDMGAYEFAGELRWYVDVNSGDDNNSGLSPDDAFATIQKGINSAAEGYAVVVYPGVYHEDLNFNGKAITVMGQGSDAAVIEASTYAVTFHRGEDANSVLRNVVIRNCGIAGILVSGCSPKITNVTVVENEIGILKVNWGSPDISNSIFWNNASADLIECQARFSCIQRGGPGEGNINKYPLFADLAGGDYHLLSQRGRYRATTKEWILDDITSPCVDAAEPWVNPAPERMPNGARLNMGAFGGTYYASMSEWPIAGDVNRDGAVNMADFAIFADGWLLNMEWAQ
ncbi:MAG: hypothetical protein JW720_04710 [Sedimentisphaerales bacterium]|nr:hypothetical protein [Sedimentisphaerales bacterium]